MSARQPLSLASAPFIDGAAMATTQIVIGQHPTGERQHDVGDTIVVYEWLKSSAAVGQETKGPRIYGTARAAAAFLHDLRVQQGRDLPCLACD